MDTTPYIATTLPAAAVIVAAAIIFGGIIVCITIAVVVERYSGIRDKQAGVDIDTLNHNMAFIEEQLTGIKDAVEALDTLVNQQFKEQRDYDVAESKHQDTYLNMLIIKLLEKIEVEATLQLEQLNSIKGTMALVEYKLPVLHDEPLERKHVDGSSTELPIVTVTADEGVGSGAEGSADPEAGDSGNNVDGKASKPGKRHRAGAGAATPA